MLKKKKNAIFFVIQFQQKNIYFKGFFWKCVLKRKHQQNYSNVFIVLHIQHKYSIYLKLSDKKNANKICVPFKNFCYVRFNLGNISTNVTVPTKSMQLSMWFYNGKTVHR